MTAEISFTDSVTLHSGEYVARYNAKSLDRVRSLVRRMTIEPNDRIADFACGNGMLLQALDGRGGHYDGVDFSPDFIASAQAWAERSGRRNYSFHCADIVHFCAAHQASYDLAATLDFSEHVDDTAAIDIYSAIRTSLRPGGRLYLHTPNLDFFLERAKDIGLLRQFPEHIGVRSGAGTRSILVRAGFNPAQISVGTIAHYNVLKLLHPLSFLPFAGKLFQARLWIEARA